jgi:hypothetical protein
MKVSQEIKDRLSKCGGDDERYHSEFDDILEERLSELDSEWMKEMSEIYEKSKNARWYA